MPSVPEADPEAKALLDAMPDGFSKQLKELLKVLALQEDSEKAFRSLEVLSRNLKNPIAKPEGDSAVDPTLSELELGQKLRYCDSLYNVSQDPIDADGNLLPICALPNFQEEAEILSWAGIGFGKENTFLIMNALRHFCANNAEVGLKKVRFWGKIMGSKADYYVAEAQLDGPGEADAENPLFEPLGSGANTFAYWTCTDLFDPQWVRLPDAQPHYIVASRGLKRIFSGDLESDVITYPHFSGDKGGKEKDLVRAVIARITADTCLNIKNYLSFNEDGTEIIETEDFQWPTSVEEVADPSSWVHCTPHILQNSGRTTYLEVDAEAEPEKAAAQETQKLIDPELSQLRGCSKDEWSFRVVSNSGGVVSGKSLNWPGGWTVYKGKTFTNIYVGYGLPRKAEFFFTAPPDVAVDIEDPQECQEPNPIEGPPAGAVAAEETAE